MKCIYCKRDEGITFKKTEHVLPQSFGKFEKNIVLRDIVCDVLFTLTGTVNF